MDLPETMTAQVIRVTRPDTLMVRIQVPQTQSQATMYVAIAGVTCDEHAKQTIVDWVETHADFGRLRVITDWMRDSYGRVLADLSDIQSGETLATYLVAQGAAKEYDTHYVDVVRDLMEAGEPDDLGG